MVYLAGKQAESELFALLDALAQDDELLQRLKDAGDASTQVEIVQSEGFDYDLIDQALHALGSAASLGDGQQGVSDVLTDRLRLVRQQLSEDNSSELTNKFFKYQETLKTLAGGKGFSSWCKSVSKGVTKDADKVADDATKAADETAQTVEHTGDAISDDVQGESSKADKNWKSAEDSATKVGSDVVQTGEAAQETVVATAGSQSLDTKDTDFNKSMNDVANAGLNAVRTGADTTSDLVQAGWDGATGHSGDANKELDKAGTSAMQGLDHMNKDAADWGENTLNGLTDNGKDLKVLNFGNKNGLGTDLYNKYYKGAMDALKADGDTTTADREHWLDKMGSNWSDLDLKSNPKDWANDFQKIEDATFKTAGDLDQAVLGRNQSGAVLENLGKTTWAQREKDAKKFLETGKDWVTETADWTKHESSELASLAKSGLEMGGESTLYDLSFGTDKKAEDAAQQDGKDVKYDSMKALDSAEKEAFSTYDDGMSMVSYDADAMVGNGAGQIAQLAVGVAGGEELMAAQAVSTLSQYGYDYNKTNQWRNEKQKDKQQIAELQDEMKEQVKSGVGNTNVGQQYREGRMASNDRSNERNQSSAGSLLEQEKFEAGSSGFGQADTVRNDLSERSSGSDPSDDEQYGAIESFKDRAGSPELDGQLALEKSSTVGGSGTESLGSIDNAGRANDVSERGVKEIRSQDTSSRGDDFRVPKSVETDAGRSVELTNQMRADLSNQNQTFSSGQEDLFKRFDNGDLTQQEHDNASIRNIQDLLASRAKTFPSDADQYELASKFLSTFLTDTSGKTNSLDETRESNALRDSSASFDSDTTDASSSDSDSSGSSKHVDKGWDSFNQWIDKHAGAGVCVLTLGVVLKTPIQTGVSAAYDYAFEKTGNAFESFSDNCRRAFADYRDSQRGDGQSTERDNVDNQIRERDEQRVRDEGATRGGLDEIRDDVRGHLDDIAAQLRDIQNRLSPSDGGDAESRTSSRSDDGSLDGGSDGSDGDFESAIDQLSDRSSVNDDSQGGGFVEGIEGFNRSDVPEISQEDENRLIDEFDNDDASMQETGRPDGFSKSTDRYDTLRSGEGFTYQSRDGSWKTGIKGQAEDRDMDDLDDQTQVYKEDRSGDMGTASEASTDSSIASKSITSSTGSTTIDAEAKELASDEESLDKLSDSNPATSTKGSGDDDPEDPDIFDA